MWISFVGGKLNVYSRLPGAAVGLREARAEAEDPVGAAALVVDELGAPEARHAEHRADDRRAARPCPSACARPESQSDRRTARSSVGRVGKQDRRRRHRAAGVFAGEQLATISAAVSSSSDGLCSDLRVALQRARTARRRSSLGEDVHRHVDQHRSRPAALGERERLLDDLGKEVRPIDAPGALHERPVDLVLRRVGVQVHFLVRVLAVVVASARRRRSRPSGSSRAPRWPRRSRHW